MDLKVDRVLVCIYAGGRKALATAAEIARKSQAKIEVMSVERPPSPMYGRSEGERRKIARAAAVVQLARLEKLAKPLRAAGLSIQCHVEVNGAITEGILQRIAQYKPSLVVIQAHKHNAFARLLLSQTDHNLIRHCPTPLLIVKNSARVRRSNVLAALDPWRINDKPSSLDARIISTARSFAHLLGGALHGAHVYAPLIGYVGDAMFAPVAIPVALPEQKKYAARIRGAFKSFCAKHRFVSRNVHLRMGDPATSLPALARSVRARMVVMGAVSRNVVKRTFIGNTAEQVLDAMPCDILVVKPEA